MRHIKEKMYGTKPINSFINEGISDWINIAKKKFSKVWTYIKGVIVQIKGIFLMVDKDNNPIPAIPAPTRGMAYKSGMVNTKNTGLIIPKDAERICGYHSSWDKAKDIYGPGNSLDYWKRTIKECREIYGDKFINEVKLKADDPAAKYATVDADKLVKFIRSRINNPSLDPLLIWGAPGIGKTAIIDTIAAEMKKNYPDYEVITKSLSNETPDNFTLPKYIEVNGSEMATDVPKTWLPVYKPSGDPKVDAERDAACGRGLLFIDELSRATPQVLNVMLPLLQEKRLNEYKMGSGWTTIAASNRMEDEMGGQSRLGSAASNRFKHVFFEPTINSWEEWAKKQNYISPLLLQWLSLPGGEDSKYSGAKFFYFDPNEDDDDNPTSVMCTPRAWTNAMRELAVFSDTGNLEGFTLMDVYRKTPEMIYDALGGHVSNEAIDGFMAFLAMIDRCGDLESVSKSIWSTGKASIKKELLDKIGLSVMQIICTFKADSLPTTKEFTNACKWIASLKSAQLAAYFLDIFKHMFVLGWVTNNQMADNIMAVDLSEISDANKDALAVNIKEWLDYWKIPDISKMPLYLNGLEILSKEYGDTFINSKVDGVDALG